MAFVKERVPEMDREFYDSLEIYDYNNDSIHRCGKYTNWVVDRTKKIYFIYVSGGTLERPEQYDLIWKGKKIVLFVKINISGDSCENNRINRYNIISIKAPKSFISVNNELIELIKEVIKVDNSVNVIRGIPCPKSINNFIIDNIAYPSFLEEVK